MLALAGAAKAPQQRLAAAALGFGALLLWRLLRRRRSVLSGEDVPLAPGAVPLLGHLPLLLRLGRDNSQLAPGRFSLLAKEKLGLDIVTAKIAPTVPPMIVVSSPELAEEVLKGEPSRFGKRLEGLGAGLDLMKEAFGDSGLLLSSSDDPRWGVAHRVLRAPFSSRGVRGLFPLMRQQATLLVEALEREVGHGGIAHIDCWVTKMAFETIAVCGLGTSFGSFADGKEHPFIAAFDGVMRGLRVFSLLPSFARFFMTRSLGQFRSDAKVLRDTCRDVVQQRRDRGPDESGRSDLLDLMLGEQDPQTGQRMTEEMIIDNVMIFLLAGQDSTAAAMATLLCYLASCPEAKAKLLKEIDEVLPDGGEVQWEDLASLTYLDMCIKETLRLVPPAGAVARTAQGDQLLGGRWRVPDGTVVMVSIMAVHHDTKVWGPDAADFRPERWEAGQPHKFAYMPFAWGPRACMGREFSLLEQKLALTKLLQRFELRPVKSPRADPGYQTVKSEDLLPPLRFAMDVDFKAVSAFTGVFSAFELQRRG